MERTAGISRLVELLEQLCTSISRLRFRHSVNYKQESMAKIENRNVNSLTMPKMAAFQSHLRLE